jgi:hypothetical protein
MQFTWCRQPDLLQAKSIMSKQPTRILPHLFLGDCAHGTARTLLIELGITGIVNASLTDTRARVDFFFFCFER